MSIIFYNGNRPYTVQNLVNIESFSVHHRTVVMKKIGSEFITIILSPVNTNLKIMA